VRHREKLLVYTSGRSAEVQCRYLVDCCVPVSLSDIASRQRLRSARRCLLTVPRHRRSTLGRRRAFSVAGPTVLNLLPDQLRDTDCTESTFRQSLKTFFFNHGISVLRRIGGVYDYALYKSTFYLLNSCMAYK